MRNSSARTPSKSKSASGRKKSSVRAAFNKSAAAVLEGARAGGGQPVLRLRTMFISLCVLALCVAGPLGLVWKQSYINRMALQLDSKERTLGSLRLEIESLNLMCLRLAEKERVEKIARARGLEYPASKQLEVIDVGRSRRQENGISGFFARVKQSLPGNI